MVNLKNKWIKLTNIQRGLIIIAIISVFIVIPSIIYLNIKPLTANEYTSQISDIDGQFRAIVKDNSLYMYSGKPWREEEPELKLMLEKLDNMKKRGIPQEYTEFHEHYTKTIEDYILWQNSANDEYENQFDEEDNKSKEIWKKLGNQINSA